MLHLVVQKEDTRLVVVEPFQVEDIRAVEGDIQVAVEEDNWPLVEVGNQAAVEEEVQAVGEDILVDLVEVGILAVVEEDNQAVVEEDNQVVVEEEFQVAVEEGDILAEMGMVEREDWRTEVLRIGVAYHMLVVEVEDQLVHLLEHHHNQVESV